MSFNLFEVSWEIANKVGGIHTVVSSKARELTASLGDRYVVIGPWLHGQTQQNRPFEEEAGHEEFAAACSEKGVSVRVGRWNVPGRPLCILVGFSKLFEAKDGILAGLWERHGVDSLSGGWDYLEPAMFGHAAGMVIEQWLEFEAQPGRAVAQFHEWMTGSGALYLIDNAPHVATIFTTHATMLGRALSATGLPPREALGGRTPDELATQIGVRAKHSMEGACARLCDVFTTVSAITAAEAELLHGRQPQPLMPNGLDLELLQELSSAAKDGSARSLMQDVASCMCGEDLTGAMLMCISGRYEMHNKGIDVLLDALAQLNRKAGDKIVCFVLVPAGTSGPRRKVKECLLGQHRDSIGIATHEFIDRQSDPVQQAVERLGLVNQPGSRVKVVQVPIYLDGSDTVVPLQYEAALRAMDLSAFPSFYEPWGYTPAESIGVGVPTITTDMAGFGAWALENGLNANNGVSVMLRSGKSDEQHTLELAAEIERFQRDGRGVKSLREASLKSAAKVAWSDLIRNYDQAISMALDAASSRPQPAPRSLRLAPLSGVPSPASATPRLHGFEVEARLPEALQPLERLAQNLWWSWDPDAQTLFRDISPDMWEACLHNPVEFLRRAYPRDLEKKSRDASFVSRVRGALDRFEHYLSSAKSSLVLPGGGTIDASSPIAYFCFEFGVHESLRIYSGGLGLLAGDHLKSASDLDLPLLGVGLFYSGGYVRQRLTSQGEQISAEAPNDPHQQPLELVRDTHGEILTIDLPLSDSVVVLRAWRLAVGRVSLYLLDSDHSANGPAERALTQRLYGGDIEHRLRQELVLGRGGVKLLNALGIAPSVVHMNEGHAAFAALERISGLMQKENLMFDDAALVSRAATAFTTHTPVPAGHDRFDEQLVRRYLADTEGWVGLSWERFMALGQDSTKKPEFNMTFLACSLAGFVNGVAKKHGEVSRALLSSFWPGLVENEVPVDHVTNGVHLPTWTRPGIQALLGVTDRLVTAQDFEKGALGIDPRALWEERLRAKSDLLEHCRGLLRRSFEQRQESPRLLARMLEGLNDDALVVGFARRFAPYKRASLLFKDPDRLAELLSDSDRPVLFLFSGKAHPADGGGRDLLRHIVEISRQERFLGKVIFLEDYDIGLARYLKQGVDVWLNNPVRPLEASGTSGMKVAANGGLNLSILDGWWLEACDGKNGWAIGNVEKTYPNQELQDQLDNESLLSLLEEQVVPLYFDRGPDGLPHAWLEHVKHTLFSVPPFFNTDRMVSEYAEKAYAKLAAAHRTLSDNDYRKLEQESQHRESLVRRFSGVTIREARVPDLSQVRSGDQLVIEVVLDLCGLEPDAVEVEFLIGHANGYAKQPGGLLHNFSVQRLAPIGPNVGGGVLFRTTREVDSSGSYRYGVRVRPRRHGMWDADLIDRTIWA